MHEVVRIVNLTSVSRGGCGPISCISGRRQREDRLAAAIEDEL